MNLSGRNIGATTTPRIMNTSASGTSRGNHHQHETDSARRRRRPRRDSFASLRPRCCIHALGTRRQRLSTAGVRSTCSTGMPIPLWTTHRAFSPSMHNTRMDMTMTVLTAMTTVSILIRSKSRMAATSSSSNGSTLTMTVQIRIKERVGTRTLGSGLIRIMQMTRMVSRTLRDGRPSMAGSGRGMMVFHRCTETARVQWQGRVSIPKSRPCRAGVAMNRSTPMCFTTSGQNRLDLFPLLLCRRLSHRHLRRTPDIRLRGPMLLHTPIPFLHTHTRPLHPHKRHQQLDEHLSPTRTSPPPPYHFDQPGLPTTTNDVFWNGTLIAHTHRGRRSRCSVPVLPVDHNRIGVRAAHRP